MTTNKLQLIENIIIPNTNLTLASQKAIQSIQEKGDEIHIHLVLGFPSQHLEKTLHERIAQACNLNPQKIQLSIQTKIVTHQVQSNIATIKGVKNIIAIASGKGGVGKSTTTANLATAMTQMGARVGVLDADLYGPSQPTMLGVTDKKPEQNQQYFIPIRNADSIQVMSIGFLVDTDQAVIWRGPMVSQALQQLLFQSIWDDVDYLFIDLPPGTGDIQLTLSQRIPVTGSVIVTTPQDIALLDARKAITMFQKVNIPIFGVLENMSVHICSQCGHHEAIFGRDGGKDLASQLAVPLLGQLPLSLPIREAMDKGETQQLHQQNDIISDIYQKAAFEIALAVAAKGQDFRSRFPKIVVDKN